MTHAHHLLADHIAIVALSIITQCARANPITSAVLRRVDRSVWLALIAVRTRPASIRDAKIHVQARAA